MKYGWLKLLWGQNELMAKAWCATAASRCAARSQIGFTAGTLKVDLAFRKVKLVVCLKDSRYF